VVSLAYLASLASLAALVIARVEQAAGTEPAAIAGVEPSCRGGEERRPCRRQF
jgi:hypothetical protein